MKLRLDPSIATPAVASVAPAAKSPEAQAATADGIVISSASAALNQSGRIDQLTAAVQGGSYETSSTATSYALVENALSGRN